VQSNRLANPSAANPGMAAGRARPNDRRRHDRYGTRLRPPALAHDLVVLGPSPLSAEVFARGPPAHVRPVLLMPLDTCVHEGMRAWAAREGLLEPAARLPALLKPYLQLPLERVSVSVRVLPALRERACKTF
jgi:hypothetical protein